MKVTDSDFRALEAVFTYVLYDLSYASDQALFFS